MATPQQLASVLMQNNGNAFLPSYLGFTQSGQTPQAYMKSYQNSVAPTAMPSSFSNGSFFSRFNAGQNPFNVPNQSAQLPPSFHNGSFFAAANAGQNPFNFYKK